MKDRTEEEKFKNNSTSFFNYLAELEDDNTNEIWWTLYIPLLNDIATSDYMETYCHYISQSGNENSEKWIEGNEDKVSALFDWLKNK